MYDTLNLTCCTNASFNFWFLNEKGALLLNGMPLRVIRKYHGSNKQPEKKKQYM
jgi:hypothetical protein